MPAINELRKAATEMMITIVANNRTDLAIRYKEECLYEVCRQWLDEHLVDDAEPVTEEWLRLVGFTRPQSTASSDSWMVFAENPEGPRPFLNVDYCPYEFWSCRSAISNESYIPVALQPKTRGDVRRLCKALGIELKGDK